MFGILLTIRTTCTNNGSLSSCFEFQATGLVLAVVGTIMLERGMHKYQKDGRAEIKLKTLGNDAGTMYGVSPSFLVFVQLSSFSRFLLFTIFLSHLRRFVGKVMPI